MSVHDDSDSVTNVITDACTIGLITAGALLVEHLTLWRKPWRLKRAEAYILGTFTLGCGFSLWGFKHRTYQAIAAWWMITALGGLMVIIAHWLRAALDRLDARAFQAGQIAAPLTAKDIPVNNGYYQTPTA